jgi:hypothetical protein
MKGNLFLRMLKHLREKEEVMLYGHLIRIPEKDQLEAQQFLSSEYARESFDYPYQAPAFDEKAAMWAAKIVYTGAQLMLYRENKSAELEALLPAYDGAVSTRAMLSADICLRFVPPMLVQLKMIDAEDKLISILENILHTWHYSGVNYPLETEKLDFTTVSSDPCLLQLYANRVVEHKKLKLAEHAALKEIISGSLGMYAGEFWRDIKSTVTL